MKKFVVKFEIVDNGGITKEYFNVKEIDNQVIGYLIKRKIKEFGGLEIMNFEIKEGK